MKSIDRVRTPTLIALVLLAAFFVQPAAAQKAAPTRPKYPDLPSETPAKFQPVTDAFDYVRREVMIPMRDGVKLHTVIVIPKGALYTKADVEYLFDDRIAEPLEPGRPRTW